MAESSPYFLGHRRLGLSESRREVRVYRSPETPVKILVPEDRADSILSDQSVKPDDIFETIAALKDVFSALVPHFQEEYTEIVLLEQHDRPAIERRQPTWTAVQKSSTDRCGHQILLHGVTREDDVSAILIYHWAMQCITNLYRRRRAPFRLAMRLELEQDRPHDDELDAQWSKHMAGDFLAEPEKFAMFTTVAPLRALALCRGIESDVEMRGGRPLAGWIAERVEHCETVVRDVARSRLLEIANTSKDAHTVNVAISLLLYYGTEDDFCSLSGVRIFRLVTQPALEMFPFLGCLPRLEELDLSYLYDPHFDWGQAFFALAKSSRVTILKLDGSWIMSSAIYGLIPLKSLLELSLNGTRSFNDVAAVPVLSALKSLKRLDIRSSGVSQEGASALRSALRDCEILWEA